MKRKESPNSQRSCAEKGEFIGFNKRTEVGVVWNGSFLQKCMFVLLGSTRKNDMPCSFVCFGQPKSKVGKCGIRNVMQIYQKGPVVECLASSRWVRGASTLGFDCEDNQRWFLTVILSGVVLTNCRAANMSSENNGVCAHCPASRDVHRLASATGELYTTNAPHPRASREELGV